MMGGLTRGSEINTFEIVRGFAQVLGAQCRYFAAPIYAESPQSRETIISQSVFQRIFHRTYDVDVSYLSVGDVSRQSLQVRYGLPEGTDARDLIAAGAVGDLLGRYLDAEGQAGGPPSQPPGAFAGARRLPQYPLSHHCLGRDAQTCHSSGCGADRASDGHRDGCRQRKNHA